jgi:2,3-bisphosphoglycerate-independent phosphoglycerate mutase
MKQIARIISEKLDDIRMLSMVDYFDGQISSIHPIFQNEVIHNTLGEILSKNRKKQLRISETEKYAHVTFFLNCGNEKSYENEDRILIPSPKIPTYDLQPEMSAYEITERLIKEIETKKYDFICVNFANADMVGHTGNITAAEKACEVLDECLNEIKKSVIDNDYILFITADHGNIEKMFDEDTKQPHTAHTLNKVPLICVNDVVQKRYEADIEYGLRDIAPTILNIMKIDIPEDMSGKPLFKMIND